MKFRAITVNYYDVDENNLQESYGTDDLVEAAKIDQDYFRNDPMLLEGISDGETEIYVEPFTPGQMMYTDEFMREVIQIVRLNNFSISINHNSEHPETRVRASMNGFEPNQKRDILLIGYGKTMGWALRDIREQLRMETGK